MWWLSITTNVESFIKCCHSCQLVQALQPHSPLKMTPVPDHAWLLVRGNIWGPFPTGENFLVCVDYFSRFPSAEIVRKITDSVFTLKLRKLFCHYGALVEMITDNGPQFTSSEFKQLMKEFNIRHCLIIPYHPYSSGEVERFNHILKKLFKHYCRR